MAGTEERSASGITPPGGYREAYFWHARAWATLTRDFGRLAHALLLSGSRGLGKRAFAWRLAHSLLCTAPTTDMAACGVCVSCRRFVAGTHPDLLAISPIDESVSIVIDQVRELHQFIALTPHTAARKIAILDPADAMNLNAGNALLKVLEEPPVSSLLILVTSNPAALPATIRSRCTLVAVQPPSTAAAREWLSAQGVRPEQLDAILELTGGAPLRALELTKSGELEDAAQWAADARAIQGGTEDPLRIAARWKNRDSARPLEWFQRHVAGLIKKEMAQTSGRRNNNSVRELLRYFDVLSEARSLSSSPLDQGLLLEDILIGWSRLPRVMG